MSPRVIAVLVAAALLAGAFWLARPDGGTNEVGNIQETVAQVAGEVMTTPPPGSGKTVPSGKIPPQFIIARGGQNLLLEDFKGKTVFINFWNTWCPPCREEMPDLNRLHLAYRDKNVEFLFINIAVQEKSLDRVGSFLQENNLQLPVYLDRRGEVANAYGVQGIPTTVVINPEGEVTYARSGSISYQQAEALIK